MAFVCGAETPEWATQNRNAHDVAAEKGRELQLRIDTLDP